MVYGESIVWVYGGSSYGCTVSLLCGCTTVSLLCGCTVNLLWVYGESIVWVYGESIVGVR